MKVEIDITEIQDGTELIDLLIELRKLRQRTWTNLTDQFTINIDTIGMPI
jgi:hypothetical protein